MTEPTSARSFRIQDIPYEDRPRERVLAGFTVGKRLDRIEALYRGLLFESESATGERAREAG